VSTSKCETDSKLCAEGYADGRSRAEEIPQGAGRDAQIIQGDWTRGRAITGQTKMMHVPDLGRRYGQCSDAAHIVIAGVLPVEDVEQFNEGPEFDPF